MLIIRFQRMSKCRGMVADKIKVSTMMDEHYDRYNIIFQILFIYTWRWGVC
jgi:hypothetical protein